MYLGVRPEPGQSIAVVGAGVSGLLSAYAAQRAGYQVSVFESANTPGGLIGTAQTPWGRAEHALHALRSTPPVLKLLGELKLPVYPLKKSQKARWIFDRGQIHRIPLRPRFLLQVTLRALSQRSAVSLKDLSVGDVGRFFLGPEFVESVLDAAMTGVFALPADQISMEAAFPHLIPKQGEALWSWARRARSVRTQKYGKGVISMITLKNGMSALIEALANKLEPHVHLNHPIPSLDTLTHAFDHIILAAPAAVASRLLASHIPDAARALERVQYVSLRTTTVFLKIAPHSVHPRGTGVLFTPRSQEDFLGILFHHTSFGIPLKGEANFSMTFLSKLDTSLDQLLEKAKACITKVWGDGFDILGAEDYYWKEALPQYNADLPKVWAETQRALFEAHHSNQHSISIFGNYTGQISVRGLIETAYDWF